MSEWNDETRAEVIEKYEAAEPTAENTMDIVTELAEEFDKTVNGVRMILSKAGVYITKAPAGTAKKEGTASKRVSKADAIDALEAVITASGADVDTDITSKLTGKAAVYFTELLTTE